MSNKKSNVDEDRDQFLKNAEEVASDASVIDIKQHVEDKEAKKAEEPEVSWEEALEEIIPLSKNFLCRQPDVIERESGVTLILPDGAKLNDIKEFRPQVEKVAEDCQKVSAGDHVYVHPNATPVRMVYRGHKINLIHEDYVVAITNS